ncbi:MAG: peptidoglycan-binding protein [Myxococcales bacterium]
MRALETALEKRGLLKGPVDGFFDANTRAAVQKLERANGWEDDGVVGMRVWRTLVDVAATPDKKKPSQFKIITSNLKRSMSWEATARELDKLLRTKPDAIGFQEFYDRDLGRLKHYLARRGYGVNLETDVPVAYNKQRFELVAENSRQFTPRTDWNPPRYGNWVALRDKKTGALNVVTNTHLTQQIRIPRNKRAHEEQVKELAVLLRDLKRRFGDDANYFLTGDMNTAKLEYLKPLLKGTGLRGVRVRNSSVIDWIFAETPAKQKRGIETASDHDSILAVFKTK